MINQKAKFRQKKHLAMHQVINASLWGFDQKGTMQNQNKMESLMLGIELRWSMQTSKEKLPQSYRNLYFLDISRGHQPISKCISFHAISGILCSPDTNKKEDHQIINYLKSHINCINLIKILQLVNNFKLIAPIVQSIQDGRSKPCIKLIVLCVCVFVFNSLCRVCFLTLL